MELKNLPYTCKEIINLYALNQMKDYLPLQEFNKIADYEPCQYSNLKLKTAKKTYDRKMDIINIKITALLNSAWNKKNNIFNSDFSKYLNFIKHSHENKSLQIYLYGIPCASCRKRTKKYYKYYGDEVCEVCVFNLNLQSVL